MHSLRLLCLLCVSAVSFAQWLELRKDPAGARRGSAIRYASQVEAFFLWGFMNSAPDLLQENPLMEVPEYDMVAFDPADGLWRNHLPAHMEKGWSLRLPLAYVPRTYSGITTGSERTVMRGATEDREGVPRPDLNIVFDQVAYHPVTNCLYYFTGGLTATYNITRRRWSDLAPVHRPPPVLGGSLAYDPLHDEIVLFGGGHVAERAPDGRIVGHTGTWVYRIRQNDWQQLPLNSQPPPRMNTRMVCDTRNEVLVLFGGDGQSRYLADTWLFDLKTRAWRPSKAPGGPPARAGHFTVYDPQTGWVIIGGGYNRKDLTDMWAYDDAEDRWRSLAGEVPTGFYISADIAPEKRLILLVSNTRKPGDRTTCNVLFPVRTTYGYRIEKETIAGSPAPVQPQQPIPKQQWDRTPVSSAPPDLDSFPLNQWVRLPDGGRPAPTRTWGSATFDARRGWILYWGGGHCGYEGNDVDAYDLAAGAWRRGLNPEYPERLWNHGVRLAGVTFQGAPWTDHGRKTYVYDPLTQRMVMVRTIRLTTGYEPEWLRSFPGQPRVAPDALVYPPSSYLKYVTWSHDAETGKWQLLGPAPLGLDTLLSTPHGVMGVNVDWPARLNDAGYQLPWNPSQPPADNAVFLLRSSQWERLGTAQPSPQNLYEMTALAFDSTRDQVILHGAGKKRDELWTFDLKTRHWRNMQPPVLAPPACMREAVYLPRQDIFFTYGAAAWAYKPGENAWRKIDLPLPPGLEPRQSAGQNRAMVYDPGRDLILLVLGTGGDAGTASVYALRLRLQ